MKYIYLVSVNGQTFLRNSTVTFMLENEVLVYFDFSSPRLTEYLIKEALVLFMNRTYLHAGYIIQIWP